MSLPDTRTENKTCQRVGCVTPSPLPRCLLHSSASRERSSQSSLRFPSLSSPPPPPPSPAIPLFIPLSIIRPSLVSISASIYLFLFFIFFFFPRTHFPLINATLILYCCLASFPFFFMSVVTTVTTERNLN